MSELQPHIPRLGEIELDRTGELADLRRMEVAQGRFLNRITDGITRALTDETEIDDGTARCIAHVLGRAFDRSSALADFGRTGEGDYLTLRDEYLALYTDAHITAITKEQIDWLGTYLVQRENTGTGRQFMNEHLPPKLPLLLVRTRIRVDGDEFLVNIPASWDSGEEDGLVDLLTDLHLPKDPALQAFLALPDVSAGVDNIMESFHATFVGTFKSDEEILRALSPLEDWESSLADWCINQGVDFDALEWSYAPLMDRLRGVYDVVERNGVLHAFTN
ncbi:hypothetical protein [uncultured Microbacterium sp.]|uniref:hypothetical protein n=1 Tax=uncultured Microbacterium sp. TaxID=191216 RepID=UPI0028EDC589|nr:hypothetical protein [uncultured Microbacterium sp.]